MEVILDKSRSSQRDETGRGGYSCTKRITHKDQAMSAERWDGMWMWNYGWHLLGPDQEEWCTVS